jgi:hypothetical protein
VPMPQIGIRRHMPPTTADHLSLPHQPRIDSEVNNLGVYPTHGFVSSVVILPSSSSPQSRARRPSGTGAQTNRNRRDETHSSTKPATAKDTWPRPQPRSTRIARGCAERSHLNKGSRPFLACRPAREPENQSIHPSLPARLLCFFLYRPPHPDNMHRQPTWRP